MIFTNFLVGKTPYPPDFQPQLAPLISQLQQISPPNPKVNQLITDLQNASSQGGTLGGNAAFMTAYNDILNVTRSDPNAMSIIANDPTMEAQVAYGQIGDAFAETFNDGNFDPSPAQVNSAIELLQNAQTLLGPYLTPQVSSDIQQALSDLKTNPHMASNDIFTLIYQLYPNFPA